jgi:predicted CXXCH cytochrome family protein
MRKVVVFFIVAIFFSAYAAYAAEIDCLMCHSEKSKGESVHAAVSVIGCGSCHSGVDASSMPHNFTGTKGLSAEGADLCFFCHDKNTFSGKSNVHMPVAGGMCTACHDPHSSGFSKLLISDEVCFSCHDSASFKGKDNVHPPVAQANCAFCHNPHQSDNEKLLKTDMPEICFNCHDKTRFYGPTIHAPVGIGVCGSCHNPHQSDNEKLLTSARTKICYECHEKSDFQKKYTHKPVAEGQCNSCHYSHASQNRSLLYRRGNLLCRKCHSEVERGPHAVAGFKASGHPVRGRKDPMRPGRTFGCLSCHLPHASESVLLFRFKAADMYDLCMNCHDM